MTYINKFWDVPFSKRRSYCRRPLKTLPKIMSSAAEKKRRIERSVAFNERTRKVQKTLSEFTLAYSQCVPANCSSMANIRPINEESLASFIDDIQGNGWSSDSLITVLERPPTDEEELKKYPMPLGINVDLFFLNNNCQLKIYYHYILSNF